MADKKFDEAAGRYIALVDENLSSNLLIPL